MPLHPRRPAAELEHREAARKHRFSRPRQLSRPAHLRLPYGVRKVVELHAPVRQATLCCSMTPRRAQHRGTEEVSFWIDDIKNGLWRHRDHDRARYVAGFCRVGPRDRSQQRAHARTRHAVAGAGRPAVTRLILAASTMSDPLLSVRTSRPTTGRLPPSAGEFDVHPGPIVTILGATAPADHGAEVRLRRHGRAKRLGRVRRRPITGREPDLGGAPRLAHVPEGREIFPFITVKATF